MSKTIKRYTLTQILDYLDCSLCYHIKYIEKRTPAVEVLQSQKNIIFKESMQETITTYYRGHIEKDPPTLKQLYDKFYRLWLKKTGTENENSVLTRRLEHASRKERETTSKYVSQGYQQLRQFYLANAELKQSVLAVNHPYEIVFDNIIITGEIPLIREIQDKDLSRIELVSFSMSNKRPEPDQLNRDLRYLMTALAFQQVVKTNPDTTLIHYLPKDDWVLLNHTANDFRRLFAVLKGFIASVDAVEPYPRPGGHLFNPTYQSLCDTYQFKH